MYRGLGANERLRGPVMEDSENNPGRSWWCYAAGFPTKPVMLVRELFVAQALRRERNARGAIISKLSVMTALPLPKRAARTLTRS